MGTTETLVRYLLLGAAACFVLGLHLMNRPATARRGNLLSATAMTVAVGGTAALLVEDGAIGTTGWIVLIVAAGIGSAAGLYLARSVQMTAMPQLVSLFNAVGGGAAALLAIDDVLRAGPGGPPVRTTVPAALDILIGAVTFAGSLVAAGKLQGLLPGRPIVFRGARVVNLALPAMFGTGVIWLVADPASSAPLLVLSFAALAFGVTMVLPIGGADMPVVISLLNAFTGTAVAMAGFVLGELVLIIGGALVGASGAILTKLMADAMNRSIISIIVGGFGTGDGGPVADATAAPVRTVTADDVAIQLAYAGRVIIVPGYGLAAAQAQHELAELAHLLEDRGVDVCHAIHPVAGRMPGHMNVLLAEANVPYPRLRELEDINPQFPQADVALVIGANDVTNPAARRPGNPISGMPILDVDKARSVIVIKRSMGHGYADIGNELFTGPRTGMFFTDAKQGLTEVIAAVRTFVG
ncbi:NAD(P)(+) transhydrogenase (Re/Si-specific) subunit beta [Actinomadura scrupuli]|uniref:NAD(P)(+) transhydrogenase (Re/Si-specific) subunit beta n=1 Tax=Actinomadura scrupuli TaxID=559629 RepID=UPI003D980785